MPHEQRTDTVEEFEWPRRAKSRVRRRSLRRALTVDCNLESDGWGGSVVLQATDVSDEGLWLETPYALEPGEELVVSFPLPGDPAAEPVWAIAEVARVGMWRRREDAHPHGMALVFTYCSQEDLNRLSDSLYGRPPRLPPSARRSASQPPAPPDEQPSLPAVLDWLLASE
jgi:hypothetical protein